MSLIHDALKKAEEEKKPEAPKEPLLTNPIVSDKKFNFKLPPLPPTKFLIYGGLILVSLIFLIYIRFLRKPPVAQIPQPIQLVAQAGQSELKKKALKLFEEKKWEESLALWKELALQTPTDREVHNNMGLTYKKLGKLNEAFQAYDKALTLHKNYAEALNNMGVLLLQQNDTKQAKDKLQQVILTHSEYAEPYFNYAILMEKEGNFKEAMRNYREYLKKADAVDAELKIKIEEKIKQIEKR